MCDSIFFSSMNKTTKHKILLKVLSKDFLKIINSTHQKNEWAIQPETTIAMKPYKWFNIVQNCYISANYLFEYYINWYMFNLTFHNLIINKFFML